MSLGHDHGHGHDHDHGRHHGHGHGLASHRRRTAGDRRLLVIALALTSLIFVAELVGGGLAHSLALISDAGHMLSDVAAQGLSLAAILIAARPSDHRRTYGYYRIEILAALANGVALFALSGWILWSAFHRLGAGAGEVHAGVMIVVAGLGLLANLVGAWLLRSAESLNVRGAYLHLVQDSLSSLAVLVGGAVMSLAHGMYWLDPALSIAIGLFVNFGAWRLVRDAVDVLLEAVPMGIDLSSVSAAMTGQPRVRGVHDLHLWTITSGMYALSAHVVVEGADLPGSDELLATLKGMLLREYRIAHTTLQVESTCFEHAGLACAQDAATRHEPAR